MLSALFEGQYKIQFYKISTAIVKALMKDEKMPIGIKVTYSIDLRVLVLEKN